MTITEQPSCQHSGRAEKKDRERKRDRKKWAQNKNNIKREKKEISKL